VNNNTVIQSYDLMSRSSNYSNISAVSYFVDPMISSIDSFSA